DLQGVWSVVEVQTTGGKPFMTLRPCQHVEITRDRMVFHDGDAGGDVAYELDPAPNPKDIDLTPLQGPRKGDRIPGVCQVIGNRLTIACDLAPEAARPKTLKPGATSGLVLELERSSKN